MNTTKKGEAPDTLAGQAGASEKVESYSEDSLVSSVSRNALRSNPQVSDPVVQAIRILARRGRQLREAQEAAAREETTDDGQDARTTDQAAVPILPGADR